MQPEYRDIQFIADHDRSPQWYVEIPPPNYVAGRACPVMIALHGHGSDRWQYVRDPRDECRGARDAAAAHGFVFISPDYRAATSWMGPAAEADVVQIVRLAQAAYRCGKVLLVGGSMGGCSALTFTALHPELIAAVCAHNGMADHLRYENFQDAIAASFGGTKAERPDEYRKRSALYHVDRFTMPVALTAGGQDISVPPRSLLEFAEKLRAADREVLLIYRPEGGHVTDYADTRATLEFAIERMGQGRPADFTSSA